MPRIVVEGITYIEKLTVEDAGPDSVGEALTAVKLANERATKEGSLTFEKAKAEKAEKAKAEKAEKEKPAPETELPEPAEASQESFSLDDSEEEPGAGGGAQGIIEGLPLDDLREVHPGRRLVDVLYNEHGVKDEDLMVEVVCALKTAYEFERLRNLREKGRVRAMFESLVEKEEA